MEPLQRLLASIGAVALRILAAAGRMGLFTVAAISHCVRPPIYFRLVP